MYNARTKLRMIYIYYIYITCIVFIYVSKKFETLSSLSLTSSKMY